MVSGLDEEYSTWGSLNCSLCLCECFQFSKIKVCSLKAHYKGERERCCHVSKSSHQMLESRERVRGKGCVLPLGLKSWTPQLRTGAGDPALPAAGEPFSMGPWSRPTISWETFCVLIRVWPISSHQGHLSLHTHVLLKKISVRIAVDLAHTELFVPSSSTLTLFPRFFWWGRGRVL